MKAMRMGLQDPFLPDSACAIDLPKLNDMIIWGIVIDIDTIFSFFFNPIKESIQMRYKMGDFMWKWPAREEKEKEVSFFTFIIDCFYYSLFSIP